MIDWFVIIIPLALIPIFLLFAFVGCVLDREGKWTPSPPPLQTTVYFAYEAGVKDNIGYANIRFGVDDPNNTGLEPPENLELQQDDFDANGGQKEAGDIPLDSEGEITCFATVKHLSATLPNPEISQTKDKEKDEVAPTFTLKPDGNFKD